jgi:hypothetical protein
MKWGVLGVKSVAHHHPTLHIISVFLISLILLHLPSLSTNTFVIVYKQINFTTSIPGLKLWQHNNNNPPKATSTFLSTTRLILETKCPTPLPLHPMLLRRLEPRGPALDSTRPR